METLLSAKGLRKSYPQPGGAYQEVLKGVDLELQTGDFVAVLGPSGTGKSTLLHLLGLMDEPTGGELAVFGKPATRLNEEERSNLRNSKIGFVFQFDSLLPEFTLAENVAMPGLIRGDPPERAEKRALELLGSFGLAGKAWSLPRETSGGERQRVALARALYPGPALVLADEPTGNLDRQNGELVFSGLRRLAKEFGAAVVLVTHNEHAAALCDRAYHLLDGRLGDGEAR